MARKKIVKEIAPRFKDKQGNFTRIVTLADKRMGDGASMGYIEYLGNELEKYEKASKKEKIEKGLEPNVE